VEVNVSMGGNLFSGETVDGFIIGNHCSGWKLEFLVNGPIKDINRTTFVCENLREVLKFDGDDHGIILLLVDTV